jgi:hypothetical protein
MLFESGSPWIVKSIKQRDLLNTWIRAYLKRNGIPRLGDYGPGRFEDEMPDLAILKVTSAIPARFAIDTVGTRISFAFGGVTEGEYLDEFINSKLLPVTLPLYQESLRRCLPVYTVSRVTDVHGTTVAHERLLLPFAENNQVDRILVSMKPISEDGKFEIKDLMRTERHVPVFEICVVIDRELFHVPPGKNSPGEEIEST